MQSQTVGLATGSDCGDGLHLEIHHSDEMIARAGDEDTVAIGLHLDFRAPVFLNRHAMRHGVGFDVNYHQILAALLGEDDVIAGDPWDERVLRSGATP